ncbi:MAG: hypothetical protein K0R24_1128 [Gammaproteobacteria bacterium]|jgi:hypothetical protein|nr:hypothetical protein [Gammaproteobacteria bacterium]
MLNRISLENKFNSLFNTGYTITEDRWVLTQYIAGGSTSTSLREEKGKKKYRCCELLQDLAYSIYNKTSDYGHSALFIETYQHGQLILYRFDYTTKYTSVYPNEKDKLKESYAWLRRIAWDEADDLQSDRNPENFREHVGHFRESGEKINVSDEKIDGRTKMAYKIANLSRKEYHSWRVTAKGLGKSLLKLLNDERAEQDKIPHRSKHLFSFLSRNCGFLINDVLNKALRECNSESDKRTVKTAQLGYLRKFHMGKWYYAQTISHPELMMLSAPSPLFFSVFEELARAKNFLLDYPDFDNNSSNQVSMTYHEAWKPVLTAVVFYGINLFVYGVGTILINGCSRPRHLSDALSSIITAASMITALALYYSYMMDDDADCSWSDMDGDVLCRPLRVSGKIDQFSVATALGWALKETCIPLPAGLLMAAMFSTLVLYLVTMNCCRPDEESEIAEGFMQADEETRIRRVADIYASALEIPLLGGVGCGSLARAFNIFLKLETNPFVLTIVSYPSIWLNFLSQNSILIYYPLGCLVGALLAKCCHRELSGSYIAFRTLQAALFNLAINWPATTVVSQFKPLHVVYSDGSFITAGFAVNCALTNHSYSKDEILYCDSLKMLLTSAEKEDVIIKSIMCMIGMIGFKWLFSYMLQDTKMKIQRTLPSASPTPTSPLLSDDPARRNSNSYGAMSSTSRPGNNSRRNSLFSNSRTNDVAPKEEKAGKNELEKICVNFQ